MTWSDVALGGAFAVGVIAGGVAVVLITRHLLTYLRNERQGPP